METIYIKNFAGIKEMKFEFKSINILIGPQGSGKSVTVKLLYFFKNFINEIVKSIENEETKRDFDKKQKETFINFFPKESWPKSNFNIEYRRDDIMISVSSKELKLILDYSENLKSILKKGRRIYKDERARLLKDRKIANFRLKQEISNKVYKCIQEELGELSIYDQFFVPAGRSFFANLQSTIFSFLSENRSLDPFLVEFGSFYESLKTLYNNFIVKNNTEKSDKEYDELIFQILNSNYLRDKEKDYLIHKDSRKVNLTNASSGQQETLPLIIILKTLNYIGSSSGTGFTLYIEEPEAHLFPTAQKKIAELLARTFNNQNNKIQIFITTHSPYILSSFNTLIYAGNLYEKEDFNKEKISSVISTKQHLQNIDNKVFSVYSLINNEITYLIDEETNQISATILDSVSEEISLEYEQLLKIEFDGM